VKIAYLSDVRIPSRAASVVHVFKMCEALSAAGNEVVLFHAADGDVDLDRMCEAYGVQHGFSAVGVRKLRVRGLAYLYSFYIGWLAARRGAEFALSRNLAGAVACALSGVQVVYEAHMSTHDKGLVTNLLFKILVRLSRVQGLVVISRALKEHFESSYDLREKTVVVLPDAASRVDIDATRAAVREDGKLNVGYVGHLYRGRGVDLLVALAKECPWVHLHVVGGEPDDVDYWRNASKDISNVTFYGYVKPVETEKYRRMCDVLVAPYQQEVSVYGSASNTSAWMSPLKIFEYMASRRAIVSSDMPVLREVLADGENALLCRANDITDWREALEKLRDDETLRRRLAENAYFDYATRYTWEKRAERLLDCFTRAPGNRSRRRILFLVSSMQGGGAERVASILCNRWTMEGCDVTLMPTYSARGHCVYPLDPRVRLDYLADHLGTRRSSVWSRLHRLLLLRRKIRRDPPDVVVSFLARVNVAAILVAVGLPVRVVVSERNHPRADPIGPFVKGLRRLVYRLADTVVVQTQGAARWYERNCPGATINVIPNPVDVPLADGEPLVDPAEWLAENRKLVLGVGRLAPQKDFDSLIHAFAKVADAFPAWDLAILGEGALRDELERSRDSLGLSKRVTLPGRAGNLRAWYARSDLYVMTSLFEGFPNTLLEALAHGVPAVSFDCEDGPAELIRHGITGLLVPPDEGVEGLARAMRMLMADEEMRSKMAHEAPEVVDRFSLDSVGQKWSTALGFA